MGFFYCFHNVVISFEVGAKMLWAENFVGYVCEG